MTSKITDGTTNAESREVLNLTDYKNLVPEDIGVLVGAKVYLSLIKEQIMSQKLSTADFNLFLYVCKRTGLDPLTKQIHPLPHWSTSLGRYVMTIVCGIDGFRLVAQRSGQYAGQDDVQFDVEELTHPNKATVTVYKMLGNQRVAFTATARWNEYAKLDTKGNLTGQWVTMPYLMLGKCAEALALRKAFPNELSGVYTQEEMDQSGTIAKDMTRDLPTPERFKKEEIIVTSGQPTDMPAAKPVDSKANANPIKTPDFNAIRKQNAEKGVEGSNDK